MAIELRPTEKLTQVINNVLNITSVYLANYISKMWYCITFMAFSWLLGHSTVFSIMGGPFLYHFWTISDHFRHLFRQFFFSKKKIFFSTKTFKKFFF